MLTGPEEEEEEEEFTLKQLLHVSIQSPSSGSVLFELAKVIVIKIK
jgi:hypothetical protein